MLTEKEEERTWQEGREKAPTPESRGRGESSPSIATQSKVTILHGGIDCALNEEPEKAVGLRDHTHKEMKKRHMEM